MHKTQKCLIRINFLLNERFQGLIISWATLFNQNEYY